MLIDFKNRSQYVKEDYRFKNRRKVLKIWAEKEMMNLNRMRRAGVRCPNVVKLKKHVLVMSFLGENGVAAPKLKDVIFDDEEQLRKAFDQCVEECKPRSKNGNFGTLHQWKNLQLICKALTLMYNECKLVHGDFSEFNILYHKGDCYIIDVAQSMDLSHPKSLMFLARDCRNIIQFFGKSGLENPLSPRQLFVKITNLGQFFVSDENFDVDLQVYIRENCLKNCKQEK
uniref:non-specific serine/threonine protein kinase n=1 Tax=Romanomermis culicivorax TaxID=13658 RepID=A0A915HNR9_ROMCU